MIARRFHTLHIYFAPSADDMTPGRVGIVLWIMHAYAREYMI